MGKETKIEWCDHTFNPWIGCAKVSPGCANCYADQQDKFRKWTPEGWGVGKPRRRTKAEYWKQPRTWDKQWSLANKSIQTSDRPRVFCASLSDWLDDEVPIEWLADLLMLIHVTPNLDWLLLTKRPQNFQTRILMAGMWMMGYRDGQTCTNPVMQASAPDDVIEWVLGWSKLETFPKNIWLGTTVEDQARADERIPHLLKIPARVRFLSCEPLLSEVDLGLQDECSTWACPNCGSEGVEADLHGPDGKWWKCDNCRSAELGESDWKSGIHWVICGGESGRDARPMHPDWARSLRDQCQRARVPFLFKQWGEWLPYNMGNAYMDGFKETQRLANGPGATGWPVYKVGKTAAGRLVDGREWNEFPNKKVSHE